MDKVLITNADDFGLDPRINEAVEAAHLAGALTSASLMVGMPATAEAARIARSHAGLGVGLHFNITLGRPLSDRRRSSLAAAGRFHPRAGVERRAMLGMVRPADVEIELRAQLEAMRALGVEPDHIDGHQHVHVLPGAFGACARVAREQGLAVRIPHHRMIRNGALDRRGWFKVVRRALLSGSLRLAGAAAPPAGLVVNDHFRCLFDILPMPAHYGVDAARLVLETLEPGVTEWMFHPSPAPAAGEVGTPLGALRPQELALLSSTGFAELLAESRVVLASYDDVRTGSAGVGGEARARRLA